MSSLRNLRNALPNVVHSVVRRDAAIRVMETGARRRPPPTHPPHWTPEAHPYYELAICYEGEMVIVGSRKTYLLRAGDALVIPPAAWHYESYRAAAQPYKSCWLTAQEAKLICYLAFYQDRTFRMATHDVVTASTLRPLVIQELAREATERPPEWPSKSRALLMELLVDFLRESAVRKGSWKASPLDAMHLVRRILKTRFREPLQVKLLAAELGLAPNYLSQRFKQVHGTSLKRYLNSIRLHHGRLLLQSGWSVKEAAAESGFARVSYFCRLYKQQCKTTPKTAIVRSASLQFLRVGEQERNRG